MSVIIVTILTFILLFALLALDDNIAGVHPLEPHRLFMKVVLSGGMAIGTALCFWFITY
ncbi:hypothetical protein KNU84_gp006 [Bacteriophage DSS3_VP1]|uniref:Uncharacterized protein n=1 Tax=Bacteriophage DSS3_VP1 TaxID=2664196 RepID=A0A7S5FY13_9CAUD|nr:hypothetical protein KNU84_gp006 [Bacteriophage DSS3_VP1]QGH74575.1 hypothetical protein DSS3VP1_00006 [Bacteriophage DSS3_VP1]